VYSLKYTDIPKAFFTPYYVGRCCTNVILGHCCAKGHSCTNAIRGHCCATEKSNNDLRSFLHQSDPRPHCCEKRNWQTDMLRPTWCCSLTLECEEHLKVSKCLWWYEWYIKIKRRRLEESDNKYETEWNAEFRRRNYGWKKPDVISDCKAGYIYIYIGSNLNRFSKLY
jgi:hypothetical protein